MSNSALLEAALASEGLTRGRQPVYGDIRSSMRGVNVDSRGREYPRVSWRDFDTVVNSTGENNDDALMQLLAQVCQPGSEAWKNYLSVRAGRRYQMDDGSGKYEIVRTGIPRHVAPWEEKKMRRDNDKFEKELVKVKKYTLSQTLSDAYIRDKYSIPMKLINSVASMAVSRPSDAAATMAEYLKSCCDDSVTIKVEAAAYAASVSAAVRDIKLLAATSPAVQLGTPAKIIGDLLFVEDVTHQGVEWTVRGPLKYATSIADIHRLAHSRGMHAVVHLLGAETARLGIEVFLADKVVSSSVIGHVRDANDLRYMRNSGTEETLSELSRNRFNVVKTNVVPLCDAGVHVATALRLNDKVVLVNQHVVESTDKPHVGVHPLVSQQVVGDDLWAYRNAGTAQPWTFREPIAGEMVCVMYHNGMRPVLSPVFQYLTTDGSLMLSQRNAGIVPGMSGGAVVAVADMAFLGVHLGVAPNTLRAAKITKTVYEDLCDFGTESHTLSEETARVEQLILTRGLGEVFSKSVEAMAAVYDGENHVGTAVRLPGGELFTMGDGERRLVQGGAVTDVVMHRREGSVLSSCASEGPCVNGLRAPQLGENVVIIGVDVNGPVVTSQRKVKFVGSMRQNFWVTHEVTEYCVVGAPVLSMNDGSVLGVVVRVSTEGFFCVALPVSKRNSMDLVKDLQRVLPKMEVRSWDMMELHAVLDLTEPSEKFFQQVELGKAWLALGTKKALSKSVVPLDNWGDIADEACSVGSLAKVFRSLQLSPLVRVSGLDDTEISDEQAASVVAALVCLVYENESSEVVDEWLYSVGILKHYGPVLGRRSSGFDVLAADGRRLLPYSDF